MAQRMELVADLREEPVPTTSPTKATCSPRARISAMAWSPAGKRFSPMVRAWRGMSGAADGVDGGREVVGVDLAIDLINGELDAGGESGLSR